MATSQLYEVTLDFEGNTPLLLKNPLHLADPRDSTTRELKALTSRGDKRDDKDYERCEALEFALSLYMDDEVGPYLPMRTIIAMLGKAGAQWKLKTAILGSHYPVSAPNVPLDYDGPRDVPGMLREGFAWTRPIVLNVRGSRSSVLRTHPRFAPWHLRCIIGFDGAEVPLERFRLVLARADRMGALGDLRPTFGRFDLSWRIDDGPWENQPTEGSRLHHGNP